MPTSQNDSNVDDPDDKITDKNKPPQEVDDQGDNRAMNHSQNLLSSKGPLGSIWVAGYSFKRLKKDEVTGTDIPSSVDKILLEGLLSVPYRILAYLLLGVVRIYLKKVEYLCLDCDPIVYNINKYFLSKKPIRFRNIVRSCVSISLPERFELDKFQLEGVNVASRDHASRKEDVLIQDAEKEFEECFIDQASSHSEESVNDHSTVGVLEQQKTHLLMQTPEKITSERETFNLAHTPPDSVLSPPHQTGGYMEVSSPMGKKMPEISKDVLRGMRASQEEGTDFDVIRFVDLVALDLINNYQALDYADRNEDDQWMGPLGNNEHNNVQEDKEVKSSFEEMHGSEVANLTDATSPEFEAVPTPAKKEKRQRSNKRKCLFDMITMLDNKVLEDMSKDKNNSDLVLKRRKVPHTAIGTWRSERVPILTKNFMEPLIHCPAMEFQYIHCSKMAEIQLSVSTAAEPVQMAKVPDELQVPVSPILPPDNHMAIAPETPNRCSTPARVFGSARAAVSDGEGGHSYEFMTDDFSVYEEEVPGPGLMNEMDVSEGDSQESHKNKNGWSGRTRTVATYLHEVCKKQQQQGEETVPLLPILKRKTKGETARFFYEVLVLSSGGYINVIQQKAYENVLLQETPKMEATLQNCCCQDCI